MKVNNLAFSDGGLMKINNKGDCELMKKFLTVCLSVLMFFSVFQAKASALSITEDIISSPQLQKVAEAVMCDFGNYSVIGYVNLYNATGKIEAVCFNFSPIGYVIVNKNDLSVPEFSPESESPFLNTSECASQYIYNGPLSYFKTDDFNSLFNTKTGKSIPLSSITKIYKREPISNKEKEEIVNSAVYAASTVHQRVSNGIYTDHTPVAWSSNYLCGLDACAIELRYLYDWHDSDLLYYAISQNSNLQQYLKEEKFIPNTGTDAYDIVNGVTYSGKFYTGINSFFAHRGSSIRARYTNYTSSKLPTMQNSFSADYPVIIGTNPASDWDWNDHWFIAYGYYYQDLSGSSLVVNDGYGNNGVHVTTDTYHYDDMILFN